MMACYVATTIKILEMHNTNPFSIGYCDLKEAIGYPMLEDMHDRAFSQSRHVVSDISDPSFKVLRELSC